VRMRRKSSAGWLQWVQRWVAVVITPPSVAGSR
jgi:hypothetical protein